MPGLAAVFCDVGGPIYDDENFVTAVLTALDELRAADGLSPVDRQEFRLLCDRSRQAQGFRCAERSPRHSSVMGVGAGNCTSGPKRTGSIRLGQCTPTYSRSCRRSLAA